MRSPRTPPTGPGGTILRAGGKDGVQRVTVSGRRWSDAAEHLFLQGLLDSCNVGLSARAAGFSIQTVQLRRRRDAGFARRYDQALGDGLLRLEHALLVAARAHAAGLDYSGPVRGVSFEAALHLLRVHHRRRTGKYVARAAHQRQLNPAEVRASIAEKVARIRRHAAAKRARPELFGDHPTPALLAAAALDDDPMHLAHDPAAPPADPIGFDQFLAVDIRVGRIVAAEPYPQARKPAFKLVIDFGPGLGTRRSSAQITEHYDLAALPGRLVAAVVNFPPRQIGPFMSEVLTLGFPDAAGHVVLFAPDQEVPLGSRLF